MKSLQNPTLIQKEKISKVGWFAFIGLGFAGILLVIFSYNYRWLILNSLGFPAPRKTCHEKDITIQYIRSGGKFQKMDFYKCGFVFKLRNKKDIKDEKEIIELLINHGADINAKNNYDKIPLDGKARFSTNKARFSMKNRVEMLMKNNDAYYNPNNYPNNFYGTLLHHVARNRKKEDVEFLINHGADVNARDQYDQTPLHYVARKGKKEIVEFLINHGADVNARDQYGSTPLDDAMTKRHREIISLLKKHGAKTGW